MASIPETMRAITIAKTGGIEVLEQSQIPVPKVKPNEVLVKNEYIGLNFIDTYYRTGLYKAPSFPYTLGREGAGTIAAVGSDATKFKLEVGTRVAYIAPSAYAEYTIVGADRIVVLPEAVSTKQGAAAMLQGLTALTMIRESHYVKAGDWVLVHAAAGGTGLWLTQLLKAVGANTIATAGSAEKKELATKAGATVVLDYPATIEGGQDGFVAAVKKLTPGGEGVVAAFDGVGKVTFDASLASLARKGSLIAFGNASGAPAPFDVLRLGGGNYKLMRPSLFNAIVTHEELTRYADELLGLVADGKIDVRVGGEWPLAEAAAAQSALEGRQTTGKVLLSV